MMEILPKITVVTATFNIINNGRETFFRECVESVHNQTYSNIEHIIMDGASTDGSLHIIQEYVDKGWVKLYSKKDSGIDEAYDNATKLATGEYLAWMNSDDKYYSNDAIEKSIKKIQENKADYSYGSVQIITKDNQNHSVIKPKIENFWKDMPFSHQSMIVKKEIVEKLGGYSGSSYGYGGDLYLVNKLILNDYKGVDVEDFISFYRIGGISNQSDDKRRQMECIYVQTENKYKLYKLFYDDITFEQVENIYRFGDCNSYYPKFFFEKFIKFMVDKKLKNFNYDNFISYLEDIKHKKIQLIKSKKILLFNKILIMLIKYKNNKASYKLFGFLPIIVSKIK